MTQRQPPALALESVSAGYSGGGDVLRGASLALAPGSLHLALGPSGAGKSTLMRLLRMDLRPRSGRVMVFGRDAARLSRADRAAARRRLGLVFQDFRPVPGLSVLENVALPLAAAGEAPGPARAKARELLEWIGLGERADAPPETLSGGQRQCAAMARAVVSRPDFILADEPTGSVDEATAARLLSLLLALRGEGTGLLLATHDESMAARLGAPALRVGGGRVRLEAAPAGAAEAADPAAPAHPSSPASAHPAPEEAAHPAATASAHPAPATAPHPSATASAHPAAPAAP